MSSTQKFATLIWFQKRQMSSNQFERQIILCKFIDVLLAIEVSKIFRMQNDERKALLKYWKQNRKLPMDIVWIVIHYQNKAYEDLVSDMVENWYKNLRIRFELQKFFYWMPAEMQNSQMLLQYARYIKRCEENMKRSVAFRETNSIEPAEEEFSAESL